MSAREILSYRDRERLKRNIDLDKRMINGEFVMPGQKAHEGFSERRMGKMMQGMDPAVREDAGIIRERIRRNQKALSDGLPGPLNGNERVQAEKLAKRCEEWLKKRLLTKREYYAKSDDPNFRGIVNKLREAENSIEFHKVANAYKQCMRQIDPETPEAGNIENLRPD